MRPRWLSMLVIAPVLVAAACVPTSPPAGAQAATLTREGAERVARDYQATNDHNNATLAVEGQGAIEDPPIRTIDDVKTRAGGAQCFFVVDFTERVRPSKRSAVLEQPASRLTFTGLVVPGRYRRITYHRTAILVANVPKASRAGCRVEVTGIYEGLADAKGDADVPAPTA